MSHTFENIESEIKERIRREDEIDYNEILFSDSPRVQRDKLEMHLAKTMGSELMRVYPERSWSVEVSIESGVLMIRNPDVSQTKGYVLSLDRSQNDLLQRMTQVGGEILERAGLDRAGTPDPMEIDSLPRDIRDDLVGHDLIAPEQSRARIAPGVK